jgi:hypothetical protein
MLRFSFFLGTGALCLALANVAGATPAAAGRGVADQARVSSDDGDAPLFLVAVRHYSVDKRVRGRTDGKHHVGTTPSGHHVHATVNKAGKVTGMHVGKHGHSKVHRVAKHAAKRLPNKKAALLPAPGPDRRVAEAQFAAGAELTPVRRQAVAFFCFVILVPGGNTYVFFIPVTLCSVPVISPGDPPGAECGELEARIPETGRPALPDALHGRGPRSRA